MVQIKSVSVALALVAAANAHIAAWGKGMFCRNGLSNQDEPNTYYPVEPLVGLRYRDWFMHGACKNFPPPAGEFLDVPAGGTFTLEMAGNRAFTTLSYNGTKTSAWPDGLDHPDGYGDQHVDPRYPLNEGGCISSPNLHAKNEQDAAGTAFAIAYESDINKVNIEDLTVFTVLSHTPYKRIATYHVPKLLPKCPEGGCICAWGWVPNGCGLANEYFLPYRCRVTNVSPNARAVAKPKKPTWCEGQPSKCTKGAKMMSIGNQAERNTVDAGRRFTQADGQWAFWTYSMRLGWANGAQEDIYVPESSGGNDDNEVPPKTSVTPPKTSTEPTKAPTSTPKPTSTSTPVPPKTDEDEENTEQPEPTKQPAFDPSSSSSQGNVAPTPTAAASSKHCRAHRGGSSLVKKARRAHRRRGALSFLDTFGL